MASQRLLQLTISRVDGPLFDGPVVFVTVPGIAGEMTILADHTPLITPLRQGTISYRLEDGTEDKVLAEGGTLEISHNHATILI